MPSHCHICGAEAVERCFTCGELFCAAHGTVNCLRCETGIAPGDRRADRISRAPLAKGSRPGWWRPQPAEDYDPPACQECQGLARYICVNCQGRYCKDHAGKNGLCGSCQKSQRGGTLFILLVLLFLGALLVLGLLRTYADVG
jgi:hypothetical protein